MDCGSGKATCGGAVMSGKARLGRAAMAASAWCGCLATACSAAELRARDVALVQHLAFGHYCAGEVTPFRKHALPFCGSVD